MARADKPIFGQPGGGRGKLFASTMGRTYEGTYLLPDGKFDRRKFNVTSNAEAIESYTAWCEDMDKRLLEAMREKVRPKGRKVQKAEEERPNPGRPETNRVTKGKEMAGSVSSKQDVIYVVMVVGGVAVTYCDTFDKAAAVCDALTLGAKASGFAAKYDVVEVKKWTA